MRAALPLVPVVGDAPRVGSPTRAEAAGRESKLERLAAEHE